MNDDDPSGAFNDGAKPPRGSKCELPLLWLALLYVLFCCWVAGPIVLWGWLFH